MGGSGELTEAQVPLLPLPGSFHRWRYIRHPLVPVPYSVGVNVVSQWLASPKLPSAEVRTRALTWSQPPTGEGAQVPLPVSFFPVVWIVPTLGLSEQGRELYLKQSTDPHSDRGVPKPGSPLTSSQFRSSPWPYSPGL